MLYAISATALPLLDVEPDYLLYSKVLLHWIPICNGAAMPLGGSKGADGNSLEPPQQGIMGSAHEAKSICKIAL